MSVSNGVNGLHIKPVILLLGEIVLAHAEWEAMRDIAELRVCRRIIFYGPGRRMTADEPPLARVFDGVLAISRTYDSTEITGQFDRVLVNVLPSSVKYVCHNGAGYDSVDAEACAARGIAVSNTPGAVDASTASTAIYLLLGALRRSHIPSTALRAGKWRGGMQLTHDPENKLLGILGMGGIGLAVAKRAVPFGMKIQYHNRRQVSKEKNTVGAKYVGLEELLRTSDIISVHLPLNASTRGMISAPEFDMMKPGVVLVNTARGPIVHEASLVEALESGKVWGAGLDVYEKEPVVHEGLLRNENCVLMPHVGTATMETQRKMELLVMDNLRMAVTEGILKTPVAESRDADLGV
ncbi:MAG: hypothetical protein Q9163_002355 [Psora crenata]